MERSVVPGADHYPRHDLVANLQLAPGEQSSSVVVNLVDSFGQNFDVAAADVRSLPNTAPDDLAPDTIAPVFAP